MIRIVLADDQAMVRTGFHMILEAQPDMEVVYEASDGVEALEAISRLRPDVALLDIRMPRMNGLQVAEQVAPQLATVMVTTFNDDAYVDTALEYGARGYLLKDAGPELLVEAIRSAYRGDVLISPEVLSLLLDRRSKPNTSSSDLPLTCRELEVARLIAYGRTNQEIATELFISLSTVKTHVARIQERLDVRNRVEIAAALWRSGEMSA
ncbi:response regulator [Corynebacterium pseudotuberculosis]|uniref:Response regulator n=1 Tax=Corynebacterium pseudotuberculosis (strain C231) TaxID=681645 RepID=D9QC35_CORP2|nr:response regulator transcription factor [Corynebacterium pseudotuberculosis]ADL11111.1 response regulator [Corynebacterium pseudotuberculosis C231]ADO26913.1 response regulator [Corynebacterium pseudotuberculosis I19]AEK92974.1 Two component transcriptional regulator [Corynebacterium pseudotuberculosis PAT10]AEP70881.1 Two component transcriptional regulator [Corynebacterium pseudotuberculosis 42/02-A]AFH52598.1 Two component transcriptional regulator [Corynebacterium pseudotuberculosis 267